MEKCKENEAVKMIRVKESMIKLGTAYTGLGNKCSIIFNAHKKVSGLIPDVHDKELQNVQYEGKVTTIFCFNYY